MKFELMTSVSDKDLTVIKAAYDHPSVSRFVSIDKKNYWNYVTENKNVRFYKVFYQNILTGTLHCELVDDVVYPAVVIFPDYQNKGIGTAAVKAVCNGGLDIAFNKICASIDFRNTASVKAFEKSGFVLRERCDELLEYEYIIKA